MNWFFWLELLARSSALLLAGELLRRLAKGRTPAFRHRLLVWVFALLLLLPALALLFPEIPVSIRIRKPAHEPKALVTVVESSTSLVPSSADKSVNWPLWIWLSGVAAGCVPLLAGSISIRKVAARASSRASHGGIKILISDELRVPVAFGLFKPRIILPSEAHDWSNLRLEAVVAHERAHIERHDLAMQMAAQLVTALWWFQPLAWLLRSRLRVESELACDQEAIKRGLRPSDYASELLAVARGASDLRTPNTAVAMVRSSGLEDRVRAILNPPKPSFQPPRTILLGLVLGGVAVAASSLTVISNPADFPRTGASMMKRTVLSALLTTAGLSAATVGGVIHDVSNAPVADAKVTLLNPDTSYKAQTVSDAGGAFTFNGSGAGQYILRIEKAGFTSIFREFDIKADSKQESQFTLTPAGEQPLADPAPTNAPVNGEAPKIVRVGGMVAQSNLIPGSKVQPVYPAAARTDRIQGTVEIRATISPDGVPVALSVVSSPSDDLSQSALEAVRQWRYRPTLLNGNPVTVVTTIIVNYTLLP